MTAHRRFASVPLDGIDLVMIGDTPVIDLFARLDSHLESFGLRGFLGEPQRVPANADGTPVVDYLTDRLEPPTPADMPTNTGGATEAALQDLFRRLDAAVQDPAFGPTLRLALVTAGDHPLMVSGGTPVLAGWGLLARRHGGGANGLAAALRDGLGRFHPAFAAGPDFFAPTTRTTRWWVAPLVSGILLGLAAGLAYWTLRPQLPLPATITGSAQLQDETINGLQDELSRVRRAIDGNACRADPALLPRSTSRPIDPAQLPPKASAKETPFSGSLDSLLQAAVAMVIVPNADGVATGTGFWIADGEMVTNGHVVAGYTQGPIIVLQQHGAKALTATIRKATPPPDPDHPDDVKPDFALLDVAGATNAMPLALSRTASRHDPVEAAGFPALIVGTDAKFQAIVAGKSLDSAPEMIVTDGTIMAVQTTASDIQVLPHTAQISPGNSGGPLIDSCGRVVGVNTFTRSKGDGSATVGSYALKSDALLDFLTGTGVAATERNEPCPPSARPRRRRRRGRR